MTRFKAGLEMTFIWLLALCVGVFLIRACSIGLSLFESKADRKSIKWIDWRAFTWRSRKLQVILVVTIIVFCVTFLFCECTDQMSISGIH
jgi:uncharacterized BrkB/YihY/UPF0761 family membrane protein